IDAVEVEDGRALSRDRASHTVVHCLARSGGQRVPRTHDFLYLYDLQPHFAISTRILLTVSANGSHGPVPLPRTHHLREYRNSEKRLAVRVLTRRPTPRPR